MLARLTLVACLFALPAVSHAEEPTEGKWVSLFNGKDLDGWTPKIKGYDFGDNYANTFRVADGMIQVRYDGYDKFEKKYGHLFYKQPFSHYRLKVEYRFVGQQANGGEGWATRNSGAMLHGEDPKGMAKDQDFPASIEGQFLGGIDMNKPPRPTCNLCTPDTNVVMDGKLITRHCTSSTSDTFYGDQWVTAEFEVRGSKSIKHFVNGKEVLSYEKPQYDDSKPHGKELAAKQGGLLIESGTISLQSESHPIDFRKVEIMLLPKE
jgi:hypothetical protein